MSRRFWQVVEDPEYMEDWEDYVLDEKDRERGIKIQQSQSAIKINGHEVQVDNCVDKFFDRNY